MTAKRVWDSAVVATGLAIGCATILSPAAAAEALANNGRLWVYVGTYTTKTSKGIYLCQLDVPTGQLELVGVAAETARPTFVSIHPNQRFLYAVGEVADFPRPEIGRGHAFAINPDGKLTLLNQQPSRGTGPCHVNIDRNRQSSLSWPTTAAEPSPASRSKTTDGWAKPRRTFSMKARA